MDTYGGGLGVLWLAIFEGIAVMYIYGVERFADDIGFMLKTKINWYWKVSNVSRIIYFSLRVYLEFSHYLGLNSEMLFFGHF